MTNRIRDFIERLRGKYSPGSKLRHKYTNFVRAQLVQDITRLEESPIYLYDPDYFFKLAHWAKAEALFEPWERNLIYNIGVYRTRGWQITEKQEKHALRIINEATISGYCKSSKLIDDLPVSTIIAPVFTPKQREFLLPVADYYNIGHLRRHLDGPDSSIFFTHHFRTNLQIQQLRTAIQQLEACINQWESGNRRDPTVSWIVPDDYVGELSITSCSKDTLCGCCKNSSELKELIESWSEPEKWLPFLSLELAHEIKRLTSNDIILLNKMLMKASKRFGGKEIKGPWLAGFPETLLPLSVYSLYRFSPNSSSLNLLDRLHAAYCSNIGHLAAFHPEACSLIRSIDHQIWTKLTVAFNG